MSRPRRAAIAGLLLLGIAGPACIRTRRDVQRDLARDLRPAQLAPASDPSKAIRELPVRIYADDDYRAETLAWHDRIEAQVERANRVLEAQIGVRLTVKTIQPWSRSGRARPLSDSLIALQDLDSGADGEWVFGFVSSSGLAPGPVERLGMARLLGRHVVVRGMVSLDERDALNLTLDALPAAERDDLLRERKLHREAAVLLHEWAHTLGAFHERDVDTIMSPMYGRAQSAFSPIAVRIIQLGLAQRAPAGAADRAGWARDYRAEVERARSAAWDAATVEEALQGARSLEA